MEVRHHRPGQGRSPEDFCHDVEGEAVQRGDLLTIAIDPRKSPAAGSAEADREVRFPSARPSAPAAVVSVVTHPPDDDSVPEVFASAHETGQASHFQRVTESANVNLKKDGTGQTCLTFHAVTSALLMSFEVVWVCSKSVANQLGSKICQLLNDDREPLHIWVHYQCDRHGYPCRLVTVSGAGRPPRPEQDQDLHDGLFTARCARGRKNLRHKFMSSHNSLQVRVRPFRPRSALEFEKVDFSFAKTAERKCKREYSGVSVSLGTANAAGEEKWEVSLEVEMDGQMVGESNTLLVIHRQVCHDLNSGQVLYASKSMCV